MQIQFSYDSSVASAPAGFTSALAYAAGVLDALITNPITVTINVGWNEIGGKPMDSGALAEGGPLNGTGLSYGSLISELTAHASDPVARQQLASLPAVAPASLPSYYITPAQEKAWGLLPANSIEPDGQVGFSAAYQYSFDPNNQTAAGLYEFVGIAEHEITHALGRIYGDGPLELANYTAPGVFATPNTGGYFSIDGGRTNLASFDGAPGGDTADWATTVTGDSFSAQASPGVNGALTPTDIAELSVLGYSENATATTDQFMVVNTSSGPASIMSGAAYAGPVPGLTQELILLNASNLNITALKPNSFIHTASGNDAIDVSAAGGTNVLDGSTGSNFLTGGTGADTFFVDDRAATQAIWSTIAGLHSGDSVTVWGVTQAGFTLDWLNDQGAAGHTGLTLGVTAPGQAPVNVTLAGYSTADLAAGKLTVGFGRSPDEPGLAGSEYMSIRAA